MAVFIPLAIVVAALALWLVSQQKNRAASAADSLRLRIRSKKSSFIQPRTFGPTLSMWMRMTTLRSRVMRS